MAAHNKKIDILYDKNILKDIENDIKKKDKKPYLLVGYNTPDNIYVIFPDEYYLKAKVQS